MAVLNLFPSRVAFTNPDGTLTAEAYRTLQVLFSRVGGALGDSGADVFGQLFGAPTDSANNLSNALSDVVQPTSNNATYSDTVQPVSFSTDFYSDVVQYQASSKDITGAVFPDVMQPASKDREAGIFTSIDVSGNASIGGTLKLAAGTVGLPSLYWLTDTTTGFYRIGANNNGYAVSGVKVLDFLSTGLAITGTASASGGLNSTAVGNVTASTGSFTTLATSANITNTRSSGTQSLISAVSGGVSAYVAYQDAGSGRTAFGNTNNGGGVNNIISIGFGVVTGGVPANTVMSINQNGAIAISGTLAATGAAGINGKTPVVNVVAPTSAGLAYTVVEQTLLNDIRTRLINFGIYT